jgi:hypothetical protein
LSCVVAGLSFDRVFWRALVGEVLLFAATEMPELQSCEETFVRLLAPECDLSKPPLRPEMPPILQAHRGSRNLTFGAAVYRPDHVGFNNCDDVERLADYLASVRPQEWTASALTGMDAEEAADEIEFVREWFPPLADLFRTAHEGKQVLVHERISQRGS